MSSLVNVEVNNGKKNPPEVDSAFAKAPRHDPFQMMAYQGDNKEVIQGFLVLTKRGKPLVKDWKTQVNDEVIEQLASACQEAGIHELALLTRQVLVARRVNYAPADHPFITRSLTKLAPGETTEGVLKRLAKGTLKLRQLVEPEK